MPLNLEARPFIPSGAQPTLDTPECRGRQSRDRTGSWHRNGDEGELSIRPDFGDEVYLGLLARLRLPKHARYPHSLPGNHYEHLNVPRGASRVDIAASFRRWKVQGLPRALAVSSEKAAVLDRFLTQAALVLLTPRLRSTYDEDLPPETKLRGDQAE